MSDTHSNDSAPNSDDNAAQDQTLSVQIPSRAADILGISPRKIQYKLQAYQKGAALQRSS